MEPPFFSFMQKAVEILQQHPRHVLQLEPEARGSFSCSGCGKCCQRPWWIAFDRNYYEQWYEIFDQHPSGLFKEPFLIKLQPTDKHYAEVRRKPGTSECIFLEDDKSCYIQNNYGESALSDLCRKYPRYEGWFGAYIGRFLNNSCPDVLELIHNFPGIRYTIGILAPEAWNTFGLINHPLGLYQGYLWLGMQLDLLKDTRLSVLQSLRHLAKLMQEQLMPAPTPTPFETFESMHSKLQQATQTHPQALALNPGYLKAYDYLLELLTPFGACRQYLMEVRSDWRKMPVLSQPEQDLLNLFLKRYLSYRLLCANYYVDNQLVFFYPFYYLLATQICVLQWLALFYREQSAEKLSSEHLLRAATVIGYRFENSDKYIRQAQFYTPSACLEGLDLLLSFDFGQDP